MKRTIKVWENKIGFFFKADKFVVIYIASLLIIIC